MSPTALADIMPTLPSISKNSISEGNHVHGMQHKRPLAAISHGDVVLPGKSQFPSPFGLGHQLRPGIPKFNDFAAQRQWQLEHMAATFRHWAREGYVLGISGHISVRDPEHADAFWTNPLGVHFGLLKASDMIRVNLEGRVIGGNRCRPP